MAVRFSIIIPVYSTETDDRTKRLQRAVKSVINQQFEDWELIIVNDGSTIPLPEFDDPRIRVIEHSTCLNRAISRNDGMSVAEGEWLCWLDSDDEYSSYYLKALDKAIKENPSYKVFNFSSIIYHPDLRSSVRPAFRPKEEGEGHEWFRSGHIATGSFIFKRELWEKHQIPNEQSPYGFAATSGFDMGLEPNAPHIDKPEKAFTDREVRVGISLGNPWGDDFLQFYLLTRDNKSKPLEIALYIQYPRGSGIDDE